MIQMFKSLWRFRFFIISSIKTDFRTKFARSKLGSAWVVLNPLAQVLMYAVVLSAVLSTKLPGVSNKFSYAIYLLAGMLFWSLFTDLISKSSTLFLDNSNLIKKIVFPKLALPTIMVGISLINNLILFAAILCVFTVLGNPIGPEVLWIFPLTLITILMSVGLGLIIGIINVFIRDVGQVIPILLQFSFWFTPIIYPVSAIPEQYHYLLELNPFYALVSSYQKVLVFGGIPDMGMLIKALTIGVISVLAGLFLFKRASSEIVDAI